jgi:hypothetical protein
MDRGFSGNKPRRSARRTQLAANLKQWRRRASRGQHLEAGRGHEAEARAQHLKLGCLSWSDIIRGRAGPTCGARSSEWPSKRQRLPSEKMGRGEKAMPTRAAVGTCGATVVWDGGAEIIRSEWPDRNIVLNSARERDVGDCTGTGRGGANDCAGGSRHPDVSFPFFILFLFIFPFLSFFLVFFLIVLFHCFYLFFLFFSF